MFVRCLKDLNGVQYTSIIDQDQWGWYLIKMRAAYISSEFFKIGCFIKITFKMWSPRGSVSYNNNTARTAMAAKTAKPPRSCRTYKHTNIRHLFIVVLFSSSDLLPSSTSSFLSFELVWEISSVSSISRRLLVVCLFVNCQWFSSSDNQVEVISVSKISFLVACLTRYFCLLHTINQGQSSTHPVIRQILCNQMVCFDLIRFSLLSTYELWFLPLCYAVNITSSHKQILVYRFCWVIIGSSILLDSSRIL